MPIELYRSSLSSIDSESGQFECVVFSCLGKYFVIVKFIKLKGTYIDFCHGLNYAVKQSKEEKRLHASILILL